MKTVIIILTLSWSLLSFAKTSGPTFYRCTVKGTKVCVQAHKLNMFNYKEVKDEGEAERCSNPQEQTKDEAIEECRTRNVSADWEVKEFIKGRAGDSSGPALDKWVTANTNKRDNNAVITQQTVKLFRQWQCKDKNGGDVVITIQKTSTPKAPNSLEYEHRYDQAALFSSPCPGSPEKSQSAIISLIQANPERENALVYDGSNSGHGKLMSQDGCKSASKKLYIGAVVVPITQNGNVIPGISIRGKYLPSKERFHFSGGTCSFLETHLTVGGNRLEIGDYPNDDTSKWQNGGSQ